MKNIKSWSAAGVIISALVAIKLFFLNPSDKNSFSSSKQNKSGAVSVGVYVAKPVPLNDKIFVSGTIMANEEIILMPEVSGKIVQMNIQEGTAVEKNELLVKINDADLQAQIKKLSLQIKLSEAQVSRLKQLLSVGGISQEEYDVSLNQLNTLKADVEYTNAQIAKTEIRSPFKGVIGFKHISEGGFVSTSTTIASIQQIDHIKIDFSIPEKYTDAIGINDVIPFTVANKNEKYIAKIYAIEPKIDPTTRTLQLRAIADNKEGKIFPGATAQIEVPLKQIENAILIPTEAIIPVLKGQKVFVCEKGIAQERMVETGVRSASGIQIISGVSAGDSVITTGIMQLKQGSMVKIVVNQKRSK